MAEVEKSKYLLKVRNWSLDVYQKGSAHSILKDIDLMIHEKETVALIGASGSGKSILSLSILGLLPAYSKWNIRGEASFYKDGIGTQNANTRSNSIRSVLGKEIGMIFQDPNNALNPIQRCGKQLLEAVCLNQGLDKEAGKKQSLLSLEMVGLTDAERMYNSYPHELSGGQLQRILIAIALAGKPRFLIADEATTNLDKASRNAIIQLLKALKNELNISILYITHDMKEASEIADRFYKIEEGRIVSQGLVNSPDFNNYLEKQELKLSSISDLISKTKSQNEVVLSLLGVEKSYKKENGIFGNKNKTIKVLNGIDLEIRKGSITGIIGPSGSGKSTLGKIALKLLDHDRGKVLFYENDLGNIKSGHLRQFRQNLQIVYQNPYNTLNPRMRIRSIVKEPLTVHCLLDKKDRAERVSAMLRKVGIEDEKHNYYLYQLSGGQRQRVAIARALITNPDFVVLDECISSLDSDTQINILSLLIDLKEKIGLCYLFISHDEKVVRNICDVVYTLEEGRLVKL